MKRFQFFALALTFALFLSACDSSDPEEDALAPAPLSSEVFEFDTDIFSAAKTGSILTHHQTAVLRFGFVTAVVKAQLLMPALLTAATLNADPVSDGSGWEWSVSGVNVLQNPFALTLRGEPRDGGFGWTMTVSGTAGTEVYDDFVLYSASSNADGSEGSWSLFYLQDGETVNVLNADFNRTAEDAATLEFSVPSTSGANGGDSVTYETNGTMRMFTYVNVGEGKTTTIAWDSVTKAGYISASDYNGGLQACWDNKFDNTACLQ